MKKYICNPLWLLLLFVAFISSCDKEEIVFDHELPQFELRSDAILLEVIMPHLTSLFAAFSICHLRSPKAAS